jgi:hypothetical protein
LSLSQERLQASLQCTDGIMPSSQGTHLYMRVLCSSRVGCRHEHEQYQSMALHRVDLAFELGAKQCLQCNIWWPKESQTHGVHQHLGIKPLAGALLSWIGIPKEFSFEQGLHACGRFWSGPAMRHALGTHMHCSPARGDWNRCPSSDQCKGQRGWIGTSGWFSFAQTALFLLSYRIFVRPFRHRCNSANL